MIPALYQDFALEYAGVVDAVSSPVHKSKAARRPVAELLHLHLWFSELMNHVADDVPSATEQNGCASNPKHRNDDCRHMSLLSSCVQFEFRGRAELRICGRVACAAPPVPSTQLGGPQDFRSRGPQTPTRSSSFSNGVTIWRAIAAERADLRGVFSLTAQ